MLYKQRFCVLFRVSKAGYKKNVLAMEIIFLQVHTSLGSCYLWAVRCFAPCIYWESSYGGWPGVKGRQQEYLWDTRRGL